MATKNEKQTTSEVKPNVTASTLTPPQSVYIQNSQDGKTIIVKSDIKKVK